MKPLLNITLSPLEKSDREQFITDNQRAFKYGAKEECEMRDDNFEEDDEIISRKTIEKSIGSENSETYRIIFDKTKIGGVVIKLDKENKKGDLVLLFINPENHSKGAGYAAWKAIEKMHPEIELWETVTPYFEKRNIHFYVNKCGFQIVEFYHKYHPDPNRQQDEDQKDKDHDDEMFRFQKVIKNN